MTSKLFKNAIFIDIHSHFHDDQHSSLKVYSYDPLLNSPPSSGELFSCGIHPWSLNKKELEKNWLSACKYMDYSECLIIGESGLDKTIKIDMGLQNEFFIRHIEKSIQYSKPLIIHCVKALNEILQVKLEYPNSPAWIIHDFNGNKQMIEECLKHNIYFSLGKRFLTQPQSKIAKSFVHIPLDKIFFETDESRDTSIQIIYEHFAREHKLIMSDLTLQVKSNLRELLQCRIDLGE